jgi:photosystem II stability/assembly factor-like uncharacterized protein
MARKRGWLFLLLGLLAGSLRAGQLPPWQPLGPYGGDVRTVAGRIHDPSRLFLGTSNGQVYSSSDGGRTWTWWSEIGDRPNYVVDHLIVDAGDASVLYAAVWSTEANGGGGVFKSSDGGRTWLSLRRMSGESVRSLAQSAGAPRVLVAGSISGVFRTQDAGQTWERISPRDHQEIRNVESVAVDPRDPDIVYAGTWHLAWKTVDGGRTWTSIRTGMIDDSDVFSIQPDWSAPGRIYASACSGIYRSENAGELWRKIQGIPHSARRTRVIRQDPRNPAIVYAGTTEGLWRSESRGDSWTRLTSPTLIVNDIFIDPSSPAHIVLGTDRAGIMLSSDGGTTFEASNRGFAHRQVSRTAFDPESGRLYVAVLNDKEYGGVFSASDRLSWRQVSKGLDGRDVFTLIYARTADGGRLLAGVRDGVMALDENTQTWSRVGRLVAGPGRVSPGPAAASARTSSSAVRASPSSPSRQAAQRAPAAAPQAGSASSAVNLSVNEFFQSAPGEPLYAATNRGILRSLDAGLTWTRISEFFAASTIAAEGKMLIAGVPGGLEMSVNGGAMWFHIYLPTTRLYPHVNSIVFHQKTILVATDAGLFRSTDMGGNWDRKGNGVPFNVPMTSVQMQPGDPGRVFVASPVAGHVYVSTDAGTTFEAFDETGLAGRMPRSLAFVTPRGAASLELLVASVFDGLFVRPLGPDGASLTRAAQTGPQ